MPGSFEHDSPDGSGYSILTPDVVISEQLGSSASVTEYPVEGSESVNDHAQRKSETASITMVISETPLPGLLVTPLIEDAITDGAEITFTQREIPSDLRPLEGLAWLRERRGQRISYFTDKFPELNDWVITNISTTRSNRRSLTIAVDMQEVRIATTQTVDLPPRKIRPKKADPPSDFGAQPTQEVQESDEKELLGSSKLAALYDIVVGSPQSGVLPSDRALGIPTTSSKNATNAR